MNRFHSVLCPNYSLTYEYIQVYYFDALLIYKQVSVQVEFMKV